MAPHTDLTFRHNTQIFGDRPARSMVFAEAAVVERSLVCSQLLLGPVLALFPIVAISVSLNAAGFSFV